MGQVKLEALGLPAGVTAAAVISEPTGPTATKRSLSIITNGAVFSGPIRIVGTSSIKLGAAPANDLLRTARTPAKFVASLETIWLTAAGKP